VINDVADEIDRTAERGLHAERAVAVIEAAVAEDADVVRATIGFEAVVLHVGDVVPVEIDRDGQAIAQRLRTAGLLRRGYGGESGLP
jgi:hypothetical protein